MANSTFHFKGLYIEKKSSLLEEREKERMNYRIWAYFLSIQHNIVTLYMFVADSS